MDAAIFLASFRSQLDKKLSQYYGFRPGGASDSAPPTSDDRTLTAFVKGASVISPDFDPCKSLRDDIAELHAQHDQKKAEAYDTDPKGHPIVIDKKAKKEADKLQAQISAKLAALDNCVKNHDPVPNQVCFEVHEVSKHASIWVCVPHPKAAMYLWYEFEGASDPTSDGLPVFRPKSHAKIASTPYPFWGVQPYLGHEQDWAGGDDSYGFLEGALPGDDPPHWSPVVVLPGRTSSKNDPLIGKTIHDLMWHSDTWQQAEAIIDLARPTGADLTDRVKDHLWAPITLRGFVAESHLSGEDYASDHATDYLRGESVSTGWDVPSTLLYGPPGVAGVVTQAIAGGIDVHDKSWPGMDWNLWVDSDRDVNYLSTERTHGQLQVEIEQFALPADYRSWVGDWVQATGRWVIDCGHPENHRFRAEIHPPELLVSSRIVSPYKTEARVIATGAWAGAPLTFPVFPPPRPSATAMLKSTVAVQLSDRAALKVDGWPADNPNHLACSIKSTGSAELVLFNTGMVGMTSERQLWAKVTCEWGEPTAWVTASGLPASGHALYRDPDLAPTTWIEFTGKSVELLPKEYVFRAAASGFDFAPLSAVLVPKSNNIHFSPTRAEVYPAEIDSQRGPPIGNLLAENIRKASRELPFDEHANLVYAARQTLADALIDWTTPKRLLGVVNKLSDAYRDTTFFSCRISSLVASNGDPVLDLDAAVKGPHKAESGAEWYTDIQPIDGGNIASFIAGRKGLGVAGAKVELILRLGNGAAGFHHTGVVEAETDTDGTVSVLIRAGTHPEDVSIMLRVIENPVNPWFLPVSVSPTVFFYPGASADGAQVAKPYELELIALNKISGEFKGVFQEAKAKSRARGRDLKQSLKLMAQTTKRLAAGERPVPSFRKLALRPIEPLKRYAMTSTVSTRAVTRRVRLAQGHRARKSREN